MRDGRAERALVRVRVRGRSWALWVRADGGQTHPSHRFFIHPIGSVRHGDVCGPDVRRATNLTDLYRSHCMDQTRFTESRIT